MDASKEFAKSQIGLLSLKERGTYRVTLLADKAEHKFDKDGVSYLVEHTGQKKKFFTASASLIEQLAHFEPHTAVVITVEEDGGFPSYKVTSTDEADPTDTEEGDDEEVEDDDVEDSDE